MSSQKNPMDNFLCPYCFATINHELVHFRSARVDTDPAGILPDDYDPYDDKDVDRFAKRYSGSDKEARLQQLKEWRRFAPREDPVYEEFWRGHGRTKTEVDPMKKFTHIDSYLRPIINPGSEEDRQLLKTQADGGVFVRDVDGMVVCVELADDGTKCADRVCPHCHNPLPIGYGKHPIKLVSVIGTTGSGKTVYLSQLLKGIEEYMNKAGVEVIFNNMSVRSFIGNNCVAQSAALPASTPVESFQQPLFFDLRRKVDGNIRTDTLVLYDVAGEVLENQSYIAEFAPFIEHSDGLVMLIDPVELKAAGKVSYGQRSLARLTDVLDEVHAIVHPGLSKKECGKPIAICIAKTDTPSAKQILSFELQRLLLKEVQGATDLNGTKKVAFNATDYAPIAKRLNEFIRTAERPLNEDLRTNYATYAFFGVTALGCDVRDGVPIGPILPRRIEEPLLWLLYQLGIIGIEGSYPLPNSHPIKCPQCGSEQTVSLPAAEMVYTTGFGPFKKRHKVNRTCLTCGFRWLRAEDEQA